MYPRNRTVTAPGRTAADADACAAFSSASWWIVLAMLSAGYALALSRSTLTPAALLSLLMLIGAGLCVRQTHRTGLRVAGHTAFVALAAALALHLLPGFHNAVVVERMRMGSGTLAHSLYLNVDKPLVGLWLLWICPWVIHARAAIRTSKTLSIAGPITIAAALGLATVLDMIAWDPKWPPHFWIWAFNNLLLVCVVEEALFRGYLLGGLRRLGGRVGACALPLSAVCFGLAHAAGGWMLVLVATVAGLGYGWAYVNGGLLAAIVVHFLLNLVHFSLFSYPMLAPG